MSVDYSFWYGLARTQGLKPIQAAYLWFGEEPGKDAMPAKVRALHDHFLHYLTNQPDSRIGDDPFVLFLQDLEICAERLGRKPEFLLQRKPVIQSSNDGQEEDLLSIKERNNLLRPIGALCLLIIEQ